MNSTFCSGCKSVAGIPYFFNTSECLANCGSGMFGNLTTFVCDSCPTGCDECTGNTVHQCTECSTNFYLIYATTTCLASCPTGQYQNSTDNKCYLCDSHCYTCDTNSSNCLSCNFSIFGVNLYLSSNKCVSNCPDGEFGN